jgi:predicted transcriptional regulator of viral defense system
MNTINKKALEKLASKPIFTAKDARAEGIHPSNLSYYVKTNLIERVARGVYRGLNTQVDVEFQWEDLVLTAHSIPNGVICLISALALYELTDEIPRAHWIAIPHATTAPKRENTRFIRMRDMETGKTMRLIGSETVRIFTIERTIIDTFRYLGKEVAIKALKAALKPNRHTKLNLKKLREYAKIFRIDIDPYLMTITT